MPDAPDFDPTDWFAGDLFGTKKKLPGERKAVFPGGRSGRVARRAAGTGEGQSAAARSRRIPRRRLRSREPKPKPKPKPKPRPKVAAKPRPSVDADPVTVRRADQPPHSSSSSTCSAQQQHPARHAAAGNNSSTASGVQWPDPPPPRAAAPRARPPCQWPDPPPPPLIAFGARVLHRALTHNAPAPDHELHGRHRRTAECRQVDAVQSAGRQAAWRWSTIGRASPATAARAARRSAISPSP